MSIKWFENKRPESLIKAIKGKLRVTDTGIAQAPNFDLLLDALFGNVVYKYDLNEKLIFKKFESAVKHCFKTDKLTKPDNILKTFDGYCLESLTIKSKYTLLTSISIHKNSKLSRLVINDCVINFYCKPPKKYITKFDAELKRRQLELSFDGSEHYQYVTVSVNASDKLSAVDVAFNALDILRAIWQFQFNKSVNILAQDEKTKYWSSSLVITGKYHSLHNSANGNLIESGLYETSNFIPMECHEIRNSEAFTKNTQLYLKLYKKCNFQDYLNDVLISYIGAADTDELDSRFMKLWSTLEILTKSDNSKEIIKRATFLYDNNVEKPILENLRRARNRHAHAGLLPKNI